MNVQEVRRLSHKLNSWGYKYSSLQIAKSEVPQNDELVAKQAAPLNKQI